MYQTNVKHDGRSIDKGHLVHTGANQAEVSLLWHKIVCRVAPGTITYGRPAYAHVLCVSRGLRLPPGRSTANVLPGLGEMPWSRAMGANVCRAVARFLLDNHTGCRTVVNPFCTATAPCWPPPTTPASTRSASSCAPPRRQGRAPDPGIGPRALHGRRPRARRWRARTSRPAAAG